MQAPTVCDRCAARHLEFCVIRTDLNYTACTHCRRAKALCSHSESTAAWVRAEKTHQAVIDGQLSRKTRKVSKATELDGVWDTLRALQTTQARTAALVEVTEAGLQSMQRDLDDIEVRRDSDRATLERLLTAYQELRQDVTAMQTGIAALGKRLDSLELEHGRNPPEASKTVWSLNRGPGRKRGISDGDEIQASKRSKPGETSPTRE